MTRAVTTFAVGIVAAFACAAAQAADIKIGTIYDYTGPFAGGGSKAAGIGNKIAIDLINERGGVEGNKIVGIYADAQSKTDVAINEAERLLNEQKVDRHHGRLFERALRADGRQGRRRQEIHVDQHLRRLGGAEGQEAAIRVPAASAFGPVRRGVVRVPRGKFQGEARQGSEGPQGRDHQRGRPLRRRRRDGQRVEVQGTRHPDRAQGSLFGDRDRSLGAGDQAAPRAARRDPAHRLQPGHHAVPASVQGSKLQVPGDDRPRRRLRPDRQADRDLRQGRELFLQRRSGGGAAARSRRP